MATINLYLDKRAVRGNSPAPIKITVNYKGQTAMQATGLKVTPSEWDAKNCRVIKNSARQQLNFILDTIKNKWQFALLKLTACGAIKKAKSATELKEIILLEIDPELASKKAESERLKKSFVCRYIKFADTRQTQGNRECYMRTLARMRAFDKNLEQRTFEDIDKNWLNEFDAFLSKTSKSVNGRACHYRNIRAVFNDAIDEEITTSYPFRKFKIRRAPTPKRSLTVEQLRTLATYPCEPHLVAYRDIFMLMFFLAGINAVDLFAARRANVVNGRLEYIRAKTHKLYSIKIEPEAAELIEKYKGKNYLLFVSDNCSNYKNYLHRLGVALKNIGPVKRVGRGGKKVREPLFPNISQYWCRHSWATIAASLDIPKETIAAGLGHGGNTVTDIYIDFDRRKVDEANRRIIDWVMYGKK